MPALDNDRHEKLVQEIFSGKNNAEAYRAVYGEQKSVFVASAAANRLLKSVKTKARLRELQAEVAERKQLMVETIIEPLS